MAYENKRQRTNDRAFPKEQGESCNDGPKSPLAGKVLAALGGHTLKARWDHPYPISAKQDEEELKRRGKRG